MVASVPLSIVLFCCTIRSIGQSPQVSVDAVHRMASGDLGGTIASSGRDELTQLSLALAELQGSLTHTVQRVQRNADLSDQSQVLLEAIAAFKLDRRA